MKDFEEEYNSIPSNKHSPSYVNYKGEKCKTIFISHNHNLFLWRTKDTYITQENGSFYMHNIFSEYDYAEHLYPNYSKTHLVNFHKKLKIYHCNSGNFVNVEGCRGYVGNLKDYVMQ